MDISTKFNINEKVFVMHKNRIVETNIDSIYIIALPQTTLVQISLLNIKLKNLAMMGLKSLKLMKKRFLGIKKT